MRCRGKDKYPKVGQIKSDKREKEKKNDTTRNKTGSRR